MIYSETMSGGVLSSGSGINTTNTTKTTSGGVLCSSTAVVVSYIPATGGAILAGSGRITTNVTNTASGGVLCAGTITLTSVLLERMSGGAILAGSGSYTSEVTDTTSGGVLCGGTVSVVTFIPMTGGAVLDGTVIETTDWVVLGGAVLDGTLLLNGITNEPPFGQAASGVQASGSVVNNISRNFSFSSSGTVTTSGNSNTGQKETHYIAAGSVAVYGDAETGFRFNKDLTLLWNINYLIQKDLTLLWNTGQLRIFWYRVIGKGAPGNVCGSLQADPCCQKFVMNVHARSLTELCQKLSKRNYKFPIDTVHKFSRPAENAEVAIDEANGIDHSCNKLTPVSITSIPECAEFNLEVDALVTIGFQMTALVNAFHTFDSSGQVYISGIASSRFTRFVPNFPHVASGSVEISGEANSIPSNFTGRGGIVAAGRAKSQSSRWSYIGGVHPDVSEKFGTQSETQSREMADIPWLLTERVYTDNSQYTQTDISYAKTSQWLVVRGFCLGLPSWASVVSIEVVIDRKSTQIGVRDLEVVLVQGDEVISDNLADTVNDWPLIETMKVYGSSWSEEAFDPNQLNDSSFGVAIRIKAVSFNPATIAKIDYISVRVSYEDLNGSILRIGGESRSVSQNYHFTATGMVVPRGYTTVKKGSFFASTGDSNLQISGRASLSFHEVGSGGVVLDGFPHVSPYEEVGSGGVGASGSAVVVPYYELTSGGASAGGSATLVKYSTLVATGGVVAAGAAFLPVLRLSYVGSGSLQMQGSSKVVVSDYSMVASGSLVISGSADQRASDLGTLFSIGGLDMEIVETTAFFLNDVDLNNIEVPTGFISKCGCLTIPLTISLAHNLARGNLFSQFLTRNNLSIGASMPLRYNVPNDSWQGNLHYRGLSSDSNTYETWTLIFELLCTDVMGGIGIGRSIWKLSMQVFRRNLTTLESSDTRVLVGILPDRICGSQSSQIDFRVSYDTQQNFAVVNTNSTIYQNTLFDNIGLFRNRTWIESPELVVKISQSSGVPIQRVDVTDAVLV